MPRKVLYRKYRPTTLADVVGQNQVTDALANAIKQGKIGHAYLFIGPRGTGKTSVARIFAHAVNDFEYQVEDNYLDIIEIDAASNTGVDNIRELREKAIIAPTTGKYKVYIIDEVHMLTKSACNALLKTLEEPPEHVIFIMATTDAYKIPITISSRTQVFTFKLAEPATMFAHLRQIADQEGIKITDEALQLVVRRGGGSFRDSLSLLDQIATLADTEITAELLAQSLGLPQEQALSQLLSAYAAYDISSIQATLKDLLNTGIKPETIAAELLELIIKDPQPTQLDLLRTLPDVQPPFPEAKLLLALLSNSAAQSATPTSTQKIQPTTPPPTQNLRPATRSPAPKPQSTPSATATAPATSPQPSTPEASPAPEAPTAAPQTTPTGPFDWQTFLDAVHEENDAVFLQLQKVDHELIDSTLHLYPLQKFTKSILEKPGNSQIINHNLPGIPYVLHEVGAKPGPKDETLSQISAIMGDVRELNGDTPF